MVIIGFIIDRSEFYGDETLFLYGMGLLISILPRYNEVRRGYSTNRHKQIGIGNFWGRRSNDWCSIRN